MRPFCAKGLKIWSEKPILGDGFVENDLVGTKSHYWNGRNVEGYQDGHCRK